jgi:hypothetical protein
MARGSLPRPVSDTAASYGGVILAVVPEPTRKRRRLGASATCPVAGKRLGNHLKVVGVQLFRAPARQRK